MKKIFSQKELVELLSDLAREYQIIGPREVSQKGIFYQPITDINDLYWGENFAAEPIKQFFLSPSEYLFKGGHDSGGEALKEIPSEKGIRIIIGLRPCEARGLTLLDRVFDPSINGSTNSPSLEPSRAESRDSGSTLSKVEGVDAQDYKDEFYLNNRKRSILIGLSCAKPDTSCFCTSLDSSPVSSRGMDALAYHHGNEFIIEIISDSAQKIFSNKGRDLTQDEAEFQEAAEEEAKGSLKFKIKPPENMDAIFGDDYWRRASQACLSCGVCTFLCPTCHCFDLVDEQRNRLRCYDGCAFCDFTVEASGVNPRPSKKERYRQRVYHKFDYFKKNFGENLCVGCGRCIRFCPVKMNIAEVADKAPI